MRRLNKRTLFTVAAMSTPWVFWGIIELFGSDVALATMFTTFIGLYVYYFPGGWKD